MHLQTEQTLGTLELLVESVPCISLPGHEDGGHMYPFVWETSQNGEFNPFNLCLSQGWLKLTDKELILKNWQEMSYLRSFNDPPLGDEDRKRKREGIAHLYQLIEAYLQNLSSYILLNSYSNEVGFIVGQTLDNNWISFGHTLYKETFIDNKQINRTQVKPSDSTPIGRLDLSEIETTLSEIGVINLGGDFGGGYCYEYDYKFVYGIAETKEEAIEKFLQKSGVLEISKFHNFYPDSNEIGEYEGCDNAPYTRQIEGFNRINQFLHNISEVMMYRFSFWTQENIYIIGKTPANDCPKGSARCDRVGIHLQSSFVYNP